MTTWWIIFVTGFLGKVCRIPVYKPIYHTSTSVGEKLKLLVLCFIVCVSNLFLYNNKNTLCLYILKRINLLQNHDKIFFFLYATFHVFFLFNVKLHCIIYQFITFYAMIFSENMKYDLRILSEIIKWEYFCKCWSDNEYRFFFRHSLKMFDHLLVLGDRR